MAFHVGQKVVCVDASGEGRWNGDAPVEGRVYTIIGFAETPAGVGLLLDEITNVDEFSGSYSARRFRPAVERKADISIFTEMLKPKQRELAQ